MTMVALEGGSFRMGSVGVGSYAGDGEGPIHEVELSSFMIDRYAVTNDHFAEFVDAVGLRHRGGALRVVVRVRRLPAR